MRLDLNILWVEDQPSAVRAQKERIDFLVRKEGFRLQVEFARSLADAAKVLSSDIFGDHIDLILMDYDLGAGPKGDEGLEEVRRRFAFKDIVFYSAQAADLLDMVAKRKVQGVFCSTRDDLPDNVNGAFQALTKKVLDIEHSRGIVMGASSDIDELANECLALHFDGLNDTRKAEAITLVKTRMAEIRKRFEEVAGEIEQIEHVNELFDKHAVYTSVDRLNLLRKLLNQLDACSTHRNSLKTYVTSTVPKRNIMAHVRVTREGFSRKLIDKNGNELTSDEMRDLRKSLLEQQENVESLLKTLQSATSG